MDFDSVARSRDLRKLHEKSGFDVLKWALFALTVGFALFMFHREALNHQSDLYIHAGIASNFVFSDPHSITSRIAYPAWHLCVSALYQLGMPLEWAAASVSALCKAIVFLLVHRFIKVMLIDDAPEWCVSLCTFLLMFVTPIRLFTLNPFVYRGVGSPTVWHNPTQQAVLATALLCVPYTLHLWYEFERRLPEQGDRTMIPWSKVVVLAILLMASLACKPTFMQALIPAAAIFFLIEWIRHPKNGRYFMQIIIAYVPAVAYFLLQYLYYTGVVVPYTSGMEFGVTWETAWLAIRSMLMMAAFPLFAVICCYRRGLFRDKAVTLCLLMVLVSVIESMCFRETGVREGHGNFNWASMSSAFVIWVVMLPKFVGSLGEFASLRASVLKNKQALSAEKTAVRVQSFGYFVAFVLLVWHAFSSFYYIYYLLVSFNAF